MKDSGPMVSVCYCTACLMAAARHFPSLSQVSPREAFGCHAVYNTSHSAHCSSMKFLFLETAGVHKVICLFWMRSGGFDKVSWIKALVEAGSKGQVTGAGWGWEGHQEKTGRPDFIWWSASAHYLAKCWAGDEAVLVKHLLNAQTHIFFPSPPLMWPPRLHLDQHWIQICTDFSSNDGKPTWNENCLKHPAVSYTLM